VVDIGQIAFGYFGHIGATPHLHGDQAFGGQHLQGLAQGRAADAIFFSQLEFVDPAARRQFAAEDPLAKQFSDLFIKSAGSQGNSGHGRVKLGYSLKAGQRHLS